MCCGTVDWLKCRIFLIIFLREIETRASIISAFLRMQVNLCVIKWKKKSNQVYRELQCISLNYTVIMLYY